MEIHNKSFSHNQESRFDNIWTKNSEYARVLELAEKYAKTDATILITGETGVGKDVLAKAIQRNSRYSSSYVPVNCAAIVPSLIESELFGHTKGAFTGAQTERKGRFEEAQNGTIFLDEIGTLSFDLQSKLLRVLGDFSSVDREIQPVGSDKIKKVRARVILATNNQLDEDVKNKKFREDLYYRINACKLIIPPLRNRKEDIEQLSEFFIHKYCERNHINDYRLSKSALSLLTEYDWPGNIRELETTIFATLLIIRNTNVIESSDLQFQRVQKENKNVNTSNESVKPKSTIDSIYEREYHENEKMILEKLVKENGNDTIARTKIARMINKSEKTVLRKIREYHLN